MDATSTAEALEKAMAHQARARVALGAALRTGPSHAYLFRGPRGAGKRAAARAFAAEILAASSSGDGEDARRRALLDPSPHPDLVWLVPSGPQHMVEEIRTQVIRAASYRPFEGGKRVFVIEAAEAMRDESQNALLKTLEEPPGFVHLILLSSEPEMLLETIVSRCQPVDFMPLPIDAVEAILAGKAGAEEIATAARLAAGDVERAELLLSTSGKELRDKALGLAKATIAPATAPWLPLLKSAEAAGAEVEAVVKEHLEEQKAAGVKRTAREIGEESKRAGRRRRTEILDFALELCATWFRDLAAVAAGATEVVFNRDLLTELQSQASGIDPGRARYATELVQDTRRRLNLNVSEELALEALFFRLARTLGRA
jgi:DNA polymerase III subunit delta'